MKIEKNFIILASGTGSNAVNLIDNFYKTGSVSGINIAAVVSNISDAPVIEKVRKKAPDIPVFVIPFLTASQRPLFEKELCGLVSRYKIDFIVLAGFMKILSAEFVSKFPLKIINIHPSLLPDFKGKDAIKRALESKADFTGVTVHYVTAEVDSGPVILQETVRIEKSDTLESLENRIHKIEHKIFPEALMSVSSVSLS